MRKIMPLILFIFVLFVIGTSVMYLSNHKSSRTIIKQPKEKYNYILDINEYKDLKLENISYIEEVKYLESGEDKKTITNPEEITSTYNMIKKIKIGKATTMACEDNTTIYKFYLNNNKEISIVFECDVLVTQNKRYLIKE